VRSELCERVVLNGDLGALNRLWWSDMSGVCGYIDKSRHRGKYMGDGQGGEQGRVFCVC
jgi:hypothetical protein